MAEAVELQVGEDGTLRAPIGDEVQEVQLPDGYLDPETVRERFMPRDTFQQELDRRVKGVTKGLAKPDDLLQDEDFLEKVVETHRDELAKRLKVKPADEPDLEKIQASVEERMVKPLHEKLEAKDQEIDKLRGNDLQRQVLEAGRELGVLDELVELVAPWVRDRVKWIPEIGDWAVVGPDGEPEYAANPTKERPYKTVAELLEDTKRSGKKKAWFGAEQREGLEFRDGPRGREPISLERFKKMPSTERTELYRKDPETWRKMQNQVRAEAEAKLFEDKD